jgi:hypothetical protein
LKNTSIYILYPNHNEIIHLGYNIFERIEDIGAKVDDELTIILLRGKKKMQVKITKIDFDY